MYLILSICIFDSLQRLVFFVCVGGWIRNEMRSICMQATYFTKYPVEFNAKLTAFIPHFCLEYWPVPHSLWLQHIRGFVLNWICAFLNLGSGTKNMINLFNKQKLLNFFFESQFNTVYAMDNEVINTYIFICTWNNICIFGGILLPRAFEHLLSRQWQ